MRFQYAGLPSCQPYLGPSHVQQGIQHGHAEPLRGVGVGRRRLNGLAGPHDWNLQIVLKDFQQRRRVEILLADADADFGRQIILREREGLIVEQPQSLDRRQLRRRIVELQHLLEFRGGRHLGNLDVGDAKLPDSLLQFLEKSGVADGTQAFGGIGRDERALSLDLYQQMFADQLAQRLAQSDAAHAQLG